MANITLSITGVSLAVIADLHTRWLDHVGPVVATTTADIDGTSSTVTATLSQALLTSQQALPAAGDSVLISGEPMSVVGVAGMDVTLQRGTLPGGILTAHNSGVAVQILQYPTPFDRIAEPLRNWLYSETQALGARSAVFGGSVAGSVQAE